MKTRFERLVVCTMILVLSALIARNRFSPSGSNSNTNDSSGIVFEASPRSSSHPMPESSHTNAGIDVITTPSESLDRAEIRVSLTNLPVRSFNFRCEGPITIVAVRSGQTLQETLRWEACSVTAGEAGLSLGSLGLKEDAVELIPGSSPALWIDDAQYRGRLRIYRSGKDRIRIVNVLTLEDYLASVVDSEMPTAFGREARKAQCIASRTYALYQMRQRASHPQFDLFASEQSQKYLGTKYRNSRGKLWAGESPDSREVVRQTAGLVCTFEGELFCTYFSSTCGGRTNCGTDMFSDAATPLCGVDCEWCRDSPQYRWTRTLQPSDRVTLSTIGDSRSLLEARPIDRILLSNATQDTELSANEIRENILPNRLLSPMFIVSTSDDQTLISGRGHGHGVGMCQWGARGLAETGRSAIEILSHYYPGCEVVRWATDEFDEPR
ncbi:MAG TPA: SpoIID/LytB domain-containing protein [Planctomycetaceae bacterium]|nr:SpoIID/LytB domain-containing protein [Planctomycetaceae bacterium]